MNATNSLDLLFLPTLRLGGFISDEDFNIIKSTFGYVTIVMSSVGVTTNCINIRIFVSMGLGEGINVSLMGLAMSDLGIATCFAVMSLANVIGVLEETSGFRDLPIQPLSIYMFVANISLMFYQTTCMVTSFIAIARCLCVALPFKFKTFFTTRKSVLALAAFYSIAMANLITVVSHMGLHHEFDLVVNKTRFVLWLSPKRQTLKNLTLLSQASIVFLSSSVVGVCIVVMTKYLKQSVRFRQLSTTAKVDGTEGMDIPDFKLSGKELQIIRQIIIICIIHTICTAPLSVVTIYRFADDEFESGKRLHNLYITASNVTVLVNLLNASTTFPIYYFYNSKFRRTFGEASKGIKAISHCRKLDQN